MREYVARLGYNSFVFLLLSSSCRFTTVRVAGEIPKAILRRTIPIIYHIVISLALDKITASVCKLYGITLVSVLGSPEIEFVATEQIKTKTILDMKT